MRIPPDFERVVSASVVTGSPEAGRETIPISPDFERVPGSGVTAGAINAGWETISIMPTCSHIPRPPALPPALLTLTGGRF